MSNLINVFLDDTLTFLTQDCHCDSTYYLHLAVQSTDTISRQIDICNTENVLFYDSVYSFIDIDKDKVYIISSEESSGLDDRNKNYSEKYSIDLIEKSNAMLNDLAEKIKKDMDEINYRLQKDLNVKELIGITRVQLQKELINVHEKEMEKIIKNIPSELKKNTEEIKEDSNEIENSSNSD